MLDYPANQAAGLQGLAPPAGPYLLAMVSHGDEQAELPLLWRLCTALSESDYAVTVLDGNQRESRTEPGLYQHLDYSFRHSDDGLLSMGWSVVPSALGLQSLCATPGPKGPHLRQLGQIFQHSGVVILYSKAEWLAPLLADSGITPLMAVSSTKNSLVTSYLALKRLLLNARLAPTILNMIDGRHSSAEASPTTVASNLSDCARNFLDYDVKALNIDLSADESRLGLAMRRLAAHLLETAIPLSTASSPGNYRVRAPSLDRSARVY